MIYQCEFRVRGKGSFPFDMLRYDQCWPRTSDDAANLAYSHPEDLKHFAVTDREICLIKQSRNKGACVPTGIRWSSFGWTLVDYSQPYSMNAEQRRKEINEVRDVLKQVISRVDTVLNSQQEAYDNMPEGLQGSANGVNAQEAIDFLIEARNSLDEADSHLDSIP